MCCHAYGIKPYVEAFLDVMCHYEPWDASKSHKAKHNNGHVIITNGWLGQSKLLANRLVEELPENSFPQRWLD